MDRSTRDQRDRCLAALLRGVLRSPLQEQLKMPIEPKTFREIQRLIADLSGLSPNIISVHKIEDAGNFGATVIAGIAIVGDGSQQSRIETICDHLRLKYRLKD
jgi:hypothetical protein